MEHEACIERVSNPRPNAERDVVTRRTEMQSVDLADGACSDKKDIHRELSQSRTTSLNTDTPSSLAASGRKPGVRSKAVGGEQLRWVSRGLGESSAHPAVPMLQVL
jgi:hypothetical protein